jgi:hypothetical protein
LPVTAAQTKGVEVRDAGKGVRESVASPSIDTKKYSGNYFIKINLKSPISCAASAADRMGDVHG